MNSSSLHPANVLSTASPATTSAPEKTRQTNSADTNGSRSPLDAFVFDRIAEAQSALWRAELLRRVLAAAIAFMAILLAWWIVDQWIWSPPVLARTLVAFAVLAAALLYAVKRLWPIIHYRITEDYAARSLERDHPELGHSLSSYIGLKRQPSSAGSSAGLADRVVQSVGAEAAKKLRTIEGPPSEATGLASWWAATIGLIAMLAIYSAASPKSIVQSSARIFQPLAALEAPQRVQISDVQPGDAEVLAGRELTIHATVKNLRDQEPIKLIWESGFEASQSGKTQGTTTGNEITFAADPDGPRDRFTTSVSIPHQASGTQRYRIEAGDASAGPFELTIRDTPVVRVAQVHYQPPAYTGQKPRTRRTGSISGVDGTRVRIVAETNRPITRAVLELNPRLVGQEVRATAGASEMKLAPGGRSAEHEFVLRAQTGNGAIVLEDYRIRIWDDADQNNADPVIHPIEITKDLPPEVRIVLPQTSPRDVPIDAQQVFEIHASDVDFGLEQVEIEVRRGIDVIARSTVWKAPEEQQGVLGKQGVLGNQVIEYRFRPSRMIVARGRNAGRNSGGLNVGDEVVVTAIATDNRRDDSDPLIVPGVTQTAPITLRIIAGSDNPTDPEPPSPDKSRSEDDQTGQPSEQGEGDSPQGQQGGGSGEASQSQKGEGQNGEQQAGKGQQSDDQSEGENQSGEDQTGQQAGSEDQPSDSQPSQGESAGGGQSSGDQSDMPDTSEATESSERQDPSDPNNNSDQASKGEPSSNPTAPNQGGQSQSNQQSNPPQDDAEAFERIKEYLDNKDNQSKPNPESDGQNQTSDPNQSNKDSQGDGNQSQEGMNDQAEDGEKKSGESQSGEKGEAPQPNGQGQSGEPQTEPEKPGQPEFGQQEGSGQNDSGQNNSGPKGNPSDRDSGSQDGQQGNSSEGQEASAEGQDSSGEGQDANNEGPNGDQPNSDQASGDQPSGDQPSENDQSGDGNESSMGDESGDSDQRGQGQESGSEASPQGDSPEPGKNSDNQSGGPDSSKPGASDPGSPDSNQADRSDGSQASDDASQSQGQSQGQSSGQSDPSGAPQSDSSPSDANRSDTAPSDSASSGGSGSSGGGVGTDSGENETELPDPVDLEYTKKATDMVLDYLDETRQAPDPELLDRLKWTEQDLQRFRDRWKDLPSQDQESSSNAELTEDMREALQSLGMRPPGGTRGTQSDRADGLKGLRDSGNRRQAPPAIRDAFEAFRRGLSQRNR